MAARLQLPYLGNAADVEASDGSVRIKRLSPVGHDVLEAPLPALVVGMQLLGEPRYPSLRGIMAAKKKPTTTWTLADIGVDAALVGAGAAMTSVLSAEPPAERGGAAVIEASPDEAARGVVEFLQQRGLI